MTLLRPVISCTGCLQAEDWSLEHEAEYVSVDLTKPNLNGTSPLSRQCILSPCRAEVDEDGCAVGLGRIVEALEVCQWPQMYMRERGSSGPGLASRMASGSTNPEETAPPSVLDELPNEGYVDFPAGKSCVQYAG